LAKELGEEINADEVNKIFKDLDENKDGKISFDEFWVWWNSGRSNKL
jgi:Ca2+-binding EF-hand superfamily protein